MEKVVEEKNRMSLWETEIEGRCVERMGKWERCKEKEGWRINKNAEKKEIQVNGKEG